MNNRYEKVKEWRKNTKIKLVEGFGSKCSMCGIKDDPVIYDFHHLNSNEKEFQLSSKIMSWENLIVEAKKCVMLCSHCHRKLHFRNLIVENPISFDEKLVVSVKNNRWGLSNNSP